MVQATAPRSYTDLAALQSISALGREDRGAALEQIGRQFESLFVSQMLKGMRAANELLNEDGLFSGWEMKFRQEMLDQQLSLSLAQGRGLGLAPFITEQLQAMQPTGAVPDKAPGAPGTAPLPLGVPAPAGTRAQPLSGGLDSRRRGDDAGEAAGAAVRQASPAEGLRSPGQAVDARRGQQAAVHAPAGIQADAAGAGSAPAAAAARATSRTEPERFGSPRDFLSALEPLARQAAARLGLDEAVLLAQSALETGWGAKITGGIEGSSRNLFNIKAGADWPGPKVTVPTLEYRDGVAVRERHSFRVYESFADSFDDFVDFLSSRPRYRQALDSAASPEGFLRGLQEAGYATDPNYADKILNVLERVASYLQER